MPTGVRIALDWGGARIGVAACDAAGVLAYPVGVVRTGPAALGELRSIVADHAPTAVVVGLPLALDGSWGIAARRVVDAVTPLAATIDPPVWLVDERLTSAEAGRLLHAAGKTAKQQRRLVDAQAATGILESVLRAERAGHPVGLPLAGIATKGTPDAPRQVVDVPEAADPGLVRGQGPYAGGREPPAGAASYVG